jgi:ABC-type bacteriocin/lantibiotic exporter with double-glycine peptidase domain
LLLGVGGWLVIGAQLTLGQLVASEIILSMIVASISKLGKQFESWYDAIAAMDKLGHLVDLRMERRGGETVPPHGGGARVQVQGLAYARLGRAPSFEDVTFSVEPGERVALLASRGMGSSSILEMLLGMRTPAAGFLSVDGMDVRTWDLDALRAQACILRSGDLIAGTIAENIRVGRPEIPATDVQRAIDAVGLSETVRALPEGIHTQLVTGGMPLTGRQRARLLGARALAARPRLLLLDEVLDGHEGTLDVLARALLDAPIPWTVIVVTHDRRVAARCGRTIELGREDARHA